LATDNIVNSLNGLQFVWQTYKAIGIYIELSVSQFGDLKLTISIFEIEIDIESKIDIDKCRLTMYEIENETDKRILNVIHSAKGHHPIIVENISNDYFFLNSISQHICRRQYPMEIKDKMNIYGQQLAEHALVFMFCYCCRMLEQI
jgi:hypothetical protein